MEKKWFENFVNNINKDFMKAGLTELPLNSTGLKVMVTEESLKNGYQLDKDNARKYLKIGEPYTVIKSDIGPWRTEYKLDDIKDTWPIGLTFNSVLFVRYKEPCSKCRTQDFKGCHSMDCPMRESVPPLGAEKQTISAQQAFDKTVELIKGYEDGDLHGGNPMQWIEKYGQQFKVDVSGAEKEKL